VLKQVKALTYTSLERQDLASRDLTGTENPITFGSSACEATRCA
jgi:hypothetical protein